MIFSLERNRYAFLSRYGNILLLNSWICNLSTCLRMFDIFALCSNRGCSHYAYWGAPHEKYLYGLGMACLVKISKKWSHFRNWIFNKSVPFFTSSELYSWEKKRNTSYNNHIFMLKPCLLGRCMNTMFDINIEVFQISWTIFRFFNCGVL